MTPSFYIKEHTFEGQHIREYPHATSRSQEDVLSLSVKQYVPKDNLDPKPGDITVIAAQGNGFPKELYEPLWEDIVKKLEQHGIRVQAIWMADIAWQGKSGTINEDRLGNDPSWFDHARDLLHMVNKFRSEMPRPIIGIAHSFGATVMTALAIFHPRLFEHLVLIDAATTHGVYDNADDIFIPMNVSAKRRDLWASREEAEASFCKSKLYQTWDPRVLRAWLKYGMRDTPSWQYTEPGKVTLTTTKHMETFTYFRPTAQAYDSDGRRHIDHRKIPDAGSVLQRFPKLPFYRPEPGLVASLLPYLKPSVIWIYGGRSNFNSPSDKQQKIDMTGTGVGGNGGVKAGQVRYVELDGFGHLVPLQATSRCAEHAADSIVPAIEKWRQDEAEYQEWAKKSKDEKQTMNDEFMRWLDSQKIIMKL